MATPQLHIHSDASKLQEEVIGFIVAQASKCISHHGHFSVGLSGGSVAKIVSKGLRDRPDIDWSKWHVFYCDERHVHYSSEDSTHGFMHKELLQHISPAAVYAIDHTLSVEEAAKDYITKIRKLYPGNELPTFDLLLLGMGPDGHTCSLFPDHPGLLETERIVIPITDSPKPPPSRITLTIPVLNNARCVTVISTGGSKADAVKGSLEPSKGVEPLPAGRAKPTNGELHWFLDDAAASKLENKS